MPISPLKIPPLARKKRNAAHVAAYRYMDEHRFAVIPRQERISLATFERPTTSCLHRLAGTLAFGSRNRPARMCRVASPPNEAGCGEAIGTRDSGIRPARCWPVLGRDGQDDRPRGETLSPPPFTPTKAKRGVLAASAQSGLPDWSPRIHGDQSEQKTNHERERSDPPSGDGSATCHDKQVLLFGVAIARRRPHQRAGRGRRPSAYSRTAAKRSL